MAAASLQAAPETPAHLLGQEGLQYLCSKYSSLITRLREEVLARQTAEAEARLCERRLREETSLRDAERHQWEEDRRVLHEEVLALRTWQRQTEDSRNVEALQLNRSAATSRQLSVRCDQLHEACAEEAQKALLVQDRAVAGGEVLIRQGEELTKLRREHAEALAKSRETSDELSTCREHLVRWRRSAGELEAKLEGAVGGRDEAETRARHLQEEMRQALRSASAARTREAATASTAGRGQRELRSREARLFALRKEGQRFAQRASSAERRLRTAESYEVAAERLNQENRDLRLRLEADAGLLESARFDMARAEAGEARASASTGELQSELRAKEALAAAARQRVAELEGELSHDRVRLGQLEGDRATSGEAMEGLRNELKVLRDEREDTRRERDEASAKLADTRRRVDRGTPQLAECRRRLQNAEEGLAKASAEAADERKARERCHAEAIRSGEKLRAARAQSCQLRERVRSLEELELRFPSRLRAEESSRVLGLEGYLPESSVFIAAPAVSPGKLATRGPGAKLFEAALPLTPSPPRSPRCFSSHASAPCIRHDSPTAGAVVRVGSSEGEVEAVWDFVARQEQRLPSWGSLDVLDRAATGQAGMFEEPRPALLTHSEASGLRWATPVQSGASPAAAAIDWRAIAAAAPIVGTTQESSGVAGTVDGELAALLAAQPRVLKLPEPMRLPHAEKLVTTGGG